MTSHTTYYDVTPHVIYLRTYFRKLFFGCAMCIQGMNIILNIVGVTFRIGLDHKVETEGREFKFEDAENLNDQDCQFDE